MFFKKKVNIPALKCGDIYFGSWFWSPSIDIMPIWAYLLAPERSMLGDFKLVSVTKYLGLSVDENKFHDSMHDIQVTKDLYHKIKGYLQKKIGL